MFRGGGGGNDSKDSPPSPPDPLEKVVDAYLEDKMIDLPLIPKFVERHIYRSVLDMALREVQKVSQNAEAASSMSFLRHGLSFTVSPFTMMDAVCSTRKRNAKKRSRKETEEQREIVQRYAQKFVTNEDIDIPLLPEFVQRRLYVNVLELMFGILQDTLHTAAVDVMGHRLTFKFGASPATLTSATKDANAGDGGSGGGSDSREELDPETNSLIDHLVEDYMETSNIAMLPDFIERRIYKHAFGIVVGVMREMVGTCRLYAFDHTVAFSLTPVTAPPLLSPRCD
jgi:hypothetical protein